MTWPSSSDRFREAVSLLVALFVESLQRTNSELSEARGHAANSSARRPTLLTQSSAQTLPAKAVTYRA